MDDQFDILFQPVQIGPVVAPNRFYQVPHCNGMGYLRPHAHAAMRGVKAEGGWGVVCTEVVEVHHSSDISPYIEGRLWDDRDIPPMEMMVEAVHRHGSLAGIELAHCGNHASNLYSRTPALGMRSMGLQEFQPGQTRSMDREDIRNVRRWHRAAALRAKQAGFDIIYCYAAHNMSLAMHFLLLRYNDRADEYGGSLENRVRFLKELIEDTKDAVGDTCAVAVRLAVDELLGDDGITHDGEGHDIVAMLAELPDLWDVNVSGWDNDSGTSRFDKEGFQESYVSFVKTLTSKPVVSVGRYTSPESMVSAIKRGVTDFVGAARPSIADPFLPQKIQERSFDDIRECIGCNICVSGDLLFIPIRCTQNPTMGEEWRRGWHPEVVAPKKTDAEVLVVGGGPAGLECARALGQRGYTVNLVEARRELGGRVALESELPGLREWRRVIDWRLSQLEKMENASTYPGSQMDAEAILESGIAHLILATGSLWRRDGVGRTLWQPIPGHDSPHVFTPDDLVTDRLPSGRVVIFDDDHYYMGGVLAELLAGRDCEVTLVTSAPLISYWTQFTLEQERILHRLTNSSVTLYTQHLLNAIRPDAVTLSNMVSGTEVDLPCDGVVLVTDRLPNDVLLRALKPAVEEKKLSSLRVIGDAEAPHIIAQAIYSGYLAACEFDEEPADGTPFRVERAALS
jgi:dimethylamine/trimethylamine dehydrogenase